MARPAPPARTRSYARCRRACRGRLEPSGLSWQAPMLDVGHGEPHSTGHVLELREVERLRPFKTALGEHLKHRFDVLRVVQAAHCDEDIPGKPSRLVLNTLAPQLGQKFRSRPLPDWAT